MGDRMAVMTAGILQQLGSPAECYDSPNNVFVAQFVGSPPMNLVTAKVAGTGENLVLKVGATDQITFKAVLRGDGILADQTGAIKVFVGNAA